MVKYSVDFSKQGLKSLESLDKDISQRILDKLKWLLENIESVDFIPLHRNLEGYYKLRVGNYRIIYTINHKHKTITLHKVGHRREIYKE